MPVALIQHLSVIDSQAIASRSGVVNVSGQPWGRVFATDDSSLRDLRISGCGTSFLSLSNVPNLFSIEVNDNPLIVLDLRRAGSLRVARANDCNLKYLNVKFCTKLMLLECSGNPRLQSLDLSDCPNLSHLNAYGIPLTELDISHNPELTSIDLGGDPLTVDAVDSILISLDKAGKMGGVAALFATNIPSEKSAAARANLLAKGWSLQLDSPPSAPRGPP